MEAGKQRAVLPYLPEKRVIIYISPDNRFLGEARKMLEVFGCLYKPTSAVLVRAGKIIGWGANAEKKPEICPGLASGAVIGDGSHICRAVCRRSGHAVVAALRDAKRNGYDPKGACIYVEGQGYVCESCWREIMEAGVIKVFLRRGSSNFYLGEARPE